MSREGTWETMESHPNAEGACCLAWLGAWFGLIQDLFLCPGLSYASANELSSMNKGSEYRSDSINRSRL